MSTDTQYTCISPDVLTDADAVIESLMAGKKLDPAIARRVHQRADRIREEIFQKHGLLDIGVPAIREFRDR